MHAHTHTHTHTRMLTHAHTHTHTHPVVWTVEDCVQVGGKAGSGLDSSPIIGKCCGLVSSRNSEAQLLHLHYGIKKNHLNQLGTQGFLHQQRVRWLTVGVQGENISGNPACKAAPQALDLPIGYKTQERPNIGHFTIVYNEKYILDLLKKKSKRVEGNRVVFESLAKHLIASRSSTEMFSVLPVSLIAWLLGFLGGSRQSLVWWRMGEGAGQKN